MLSRLPLVTLGCLSLGLCATSVEADGIGKHVHGAVTFNVALEGNVLSLEIDAPAINVLGFEKSPRNDVERQAVAAIDAWLSSGREIAAVPRAAGCRLQSVTYEAPKLGSGHADYRPRYAFRCEFKEVEKAQVNVISATMQRQETLAPGSLRVSIK
jgi:hypothetical protein